MPRWNRESRTGRDYRVADLWQKEQWIHEKREKWPQEGPENAFPPPRNAVEIPNVVKQHSGMPQRKRKQRARQQRASDEYQVIQWGSQTARGPTAEEAATFTRSGFPREEIHSAVWRPNGVGRRPSGRIHLDWRPRSTCREEEMKERRAKEWIIAQEQHRTKFEALQKTLDSSSPGEETQMPIEIGHGGAFRLLPPVPPTGHKPSLKYKAPPPTNGTQSHQGPVLGADMPGAGEASSDVNSHRM